jgi:hypothetical protein
MKFIKNVPNLKISQNNQYIFEIKTVQKFDEDEDRVILKCAEEILEFKRGFVCDMNCIYTIIETDDDFKTIGERVDIIKDLILVYINKYSQYDELTEFEYIFYK